MAVKPPILSEPYNQRLFASSGVRGWYHRSRYVWLRECIRSLGIASPRVIELGCYDGKTLDYIDPPAYYLGLDANWEGGLDIGQQRWAGHSNVELRECHSPDDMPERGRFDVGVCMEVLEHMPYDLAERYLQKLSSVITNTLLIAAPREHGVIYLVKHLTKAAMGWRGLDRSVSWRESALLTFGLTPRVPHQDHIGYDERITAASVAKYFDIHRIEGIFPPFTPRALSFSAGIIARKRQ